MTTAQHQERADVAEWAASRPTTRQLKTRLTGMSDANIADEIDRLRKLLERGDLTETQEAAFDLLCETGRRRAIS